MAYGEKVLDHYENPRNVGKMDPNDKKVGTGMVGAPACGDVMRLQIEVSDKGIIEGAVFKTYGCFASNVEVNTPTNAKKISDLNVGDKVLAWNGENIVENEIEKILKRSVDKSDLLKIVFQREAHRDGMKPGQFQLICTKEHVFWSANNKPILAKDLVAGQELYEITEYELRKLTNNRHRIEIKEQNSKRMKEFNSGFDHASLPQNQPGYICKDPQGASRLKSAASIKNWADENYRKNWSIGMGKIDRSAPTSIELRFIKLFEENNVAVEYSAGEAWLQTTSGPASPDFVVPGKKKCIEVYTEKMPKFMQDRGKNSDYVSDRGAQLKTAGYDTLFLPIEEIDGALEKVQNFVHNGMKVVSVSNITHGNELRGCERNEQEVVVYDLKLKEGAHVYFTNRVGSHNCGSAIASSSLLTEWVKGKTLEEAAGIKNSQFAEELYLPP
jgi:NifU-like protein involved in Fe-S cluster formation